MATLTPLEDPMTLVMRRQEEEKKGREDFAPYRAQAEEGRAACRQTAGAICPSSPVAEGFVAKEDAEKLFAPELDPEISRPGPAPKGKYVPGKDQDLRTDDFESYLRRSGRSAPALEDPSAPPVRLAPEVPFAGEAAGPAPAAPAGITAESLRGWREVLLFALLGLVLIAGIDRLLAMGESLVYARM